MCVAVPVTPLTLLETVGDDVGEILVLADAHQAIRSASPATEYTSRDAIEVGDLRATSGIRSTSALMRDDGGDHRREPTDFRAPSGRTRSGAVGEADGVGRPTE